MTADATEPLSSPPPETPAAKWRVGGLPDPHGRRYDGERAKLCHGAMTDDELANAVFLDPSIDLLTAAKDRIRWLSRRLVEAEAIRDSVTADSDRIARNRDMWKGQCQRQAEQLRRLNGGPKP